MDFSRLQAMRLVRVFPHRELIKNIVIPPTPGNECSEMVGAKRTLAAFIRSSHMLGLWSNYAVVPGWVISPQAIDRSGSAAAASNCFIAFTVLP
jgi:hypothetical protein